MKISALIFDVDGTLAETEEAHRRAFNKTFPEFGLSWVWNQALYGELLKTTGGKERMTTFQRDHLGEEVDQGLIAEIHAQKTHHYGELISNGDVELRPGIAELIKDTQMQGIRLAIATTTNRPNVDGLVEACFGVSADMVFEVIAAGDEVQNKKPAPDVYELAVEGLGVAPEECLALEDSRNGLLSAVNARVACIISPGRYTLGADFSEAAAIVDCFSKVDSMSKLNAVLG